MTSSANVPGSRTCRSSSPRSRPTSRPARSGGSRRGRSTPPSVHPLRCHGFSTPVVMDGRLLADGGLLNPLPIAPTVAARADLTVAVAVSGPSDAGGCGRPARSGYRGDVLPLNRDARPRQQALRGIRTRLAALRSASPGKTTPQIAEEVTSAVFEAAAGGLRIFDVMELSSKPCGPRFCVARSPAIRPTCSSRSPGRSCRTFDFHKAEEMIGLGATNSRSRPSTREWALRTRSQVLEAASGSVRSPAQATCPSGRINTAGGAATSPRTGSSHTPSCLASTNRTRSPKERCRNRRVHRG